MFKEAGLDKEDVTRFLIMDNAANNKRAATLGAGEFTSIWCCCHTLQLAVKDAMRVKIGTVRVRKVVRKCKDVSNLVRRAEARRDELKEACKEKEVPFIYPVKPGKTRWNSMEGNIHSCLKLRSPLLHLSFYDRGNTWSVAVPTVMEFDVADAVQQCLSPLKIATKLWESENKPAIHQVVKQLFNIRTALQDIATSSPHAKMFARNLLKNVEKRFPKCGTTNKMFALAHFLDPDCKGIILREFGVYDQTVDMVKRMARKYDPTPVQGREEIGNTSATGEESSEPLTGIERLKKKRRVSGDIPDAPPVASRIEIEVERYENLPLETCDNPLESWKTNAGSFDILKKLAVDILPIPPSSSSSERVFSVATRACRKERLRMAPRTITNLMMININREKIEKYKKTTGITKRYTGDIKKLVQIDFPDELDVETEPPTYNDPVDVDIGFDVSDEMCSDDSELDSSESERESDSDEEEEEEEEED